MTTRSAIPEHIILLGPGAAGSALARALRAGGHAPKYIASRRPEPGRALATEVGAEFVGRNFGHIEPPALLIMAVPDDAIEQVAADCVELRQDWSGFVACHLSGARSAEALRDMKRHGALTVSFHPMVALRPHSPAAVFRQARVNIEGDTEAANVCVELALAIGAQPYVVSYPTKKAIHLSATIASNYLVTLLSVAAEVLAREDVPREQFEGLFRPLVEVTLRNIDFSSPADALTGPVSRADVATVRSHLEHVQHRHPEFLPLIANLVTETARIAAAGGRVTLEECDSLLDIVREIIDSSRL